MQFSGDLLHPTVLEIVALLFLAYWLVYRPGKLLARVLLSQCQCAHKRILKPSPNDYAVITGATDGIGLEYAKQLAEKGFNLVLLSRTEEKLKRVALEIAKLYPQCTDIQTLAVDFSQTDIYPAIEQKLSTLPGQVKVLVNNVGTMNALPEYFTKLSPGLNLKMINVNMVALTAMSEMLIRRMVANEPAKGSKIRGVVINISSGAGLVPLPLLATYSATKSYINYLGKALATEYAPEGILIQVVTPGMVDTNLASEMKSVNGSAMAVPVDAFVRYALKSVGSESYTSAHPKHKLITWIGITLNDLLGDALIQKLMLSMNKGMKENGEKMKTRLSNQP